MSETLPVGLSLIVLGGILIGGFALPMKFAPRWPWEVIWLVYSVTGLLLFPIAIALATLPPLYDIYARSSSSSLALAALFGFGWGIGAVLFGVGINRLGLSLGYSIIMGLTAALGTLIPMLVLTPGAIATRKGALTLAGLAIILFGVYLCGRASGAKKPTSSGRSGGSRRTGLTICIFSGILASMLNLAMAFGQDIAHQAVELGATTSNAANAIWVLAVAFGAIANVGFCVFLLTRHRTGSVLRVPNSRSHWFMGILMGALWFGGITVYGRGAGALGNWGPVLGWPLFIAVMIVTANVVGWLTGEWRGAPRGARRTMLAGVAVLSAGICMIGYSGTL